MQHLPSKHKTSVPSHNVGPTSSTSIEHCTNVIQNVCVVFAGWWSLTGKRKARGVQTKIPLPTNRPGNHNINSHLFNLCNHLVNMVNITLVHGCSQ